MQRRSIDRLIGWLDLCKYTTPGGDEECKVSFVGSALSLSLSLSHMLFTNPRLVDIVEYEGGEGKKIILTRRSENRHRTRSNSGAKGAKDGK
jgi:hypothetical protein